MSKLCVLSLAAAALALAQETKTEVRTFQYKISGSDLAQAGPSGRSQVIIRRGQPGGPGGGTEDVLDTTNGFFLAGGPTSLSIARFSANPVKGAPYSAETVTETVQTLADGNRIVTRQTGKLYRDAEGRTRTENSLTPVGMWVPENKGATIISIDDPLSGEHITLNGADRSTQKVLVHRTNGKTDVAVGTATSGVAGPMTIEIEQSSGVAKAGEAVRTHKESRTVTNVNVIGQAWPAVPDNAKQESLGKRVIEGVECSGTRTTVTLPAGQIGNERPIDMVTERWFSDDLKMEILRTHSDPRSGEVTYKVTGLIRGDQPKSLFELPADLKVEGIDELQMKRHAEMMLLQEKAKAATKKDE